MQPDIEDLRARFRGADRRLLRLNLALQPLSLRDAHLVRAMMLGSLCVHIQDEIWDEVLASALKQLSERNSESPTS
jgi:hypothetical protein